VLLLKEEMRRVLVFLE
jgi:hypothetical protein